MPDINKEELLSFISAEYRCIYYATPKCASMSLKHLLTSDEYGFLECPEDGYSMDYFKFGVVRNPWDKLVSVYSDIMREVNPITEARSSTTILRCFGCLHKDLDFKTFINKIYKYHYNTRITKDLRDFLSHFLPCYYFIPDDIDCVIDFYELKTGLQHAFDIIGLEAEIPCMNKSEHAPYREYYDNELKDMVHEMYILDIERFGFIF